MKEVTIKKGKHFVKMDDRITKYRKAPTKVSWKYIFQENCNYNLGTADQFDWNKLTGLYFNLLRTRAETVMVGWRYNIEKDIIELCAYYHILRKREFTAPIIAIKRGEELNVTIEISYEPKYYKVILSSSENIGEHQIAFFHNRKICGQINFYFGGNEAAPQDVSVQLELIHDE